MRVARRQGQPMAVFVTRLTVTAVLAYGLALWLQPSPVPLLAPLTALLVLQVSLYKTVRSAVQRIASVVAGVLVAVVLSASAGFTWWSLGLSIAAALILGYALRLGDHILEVPISAMLILSVSAGTAATDRIVETLIGAATGLLASFIASPVRVQCAEEAIEDLSRRLADLLDRMATGLSEDASPCAADDWLAQARTLGRELHRVDRALSEAEDSIRLNPRALRLGHTGVALRSGLETLELAAINIRGLARSMADHSRSPDPDGPMNDGDTQDRLVATLQELAKAVRAFGLVVRADSTSTSEPLEPVLERHLAAAQHQRDRLADLLRANPARQSETWQLHGELLVHIDRLRDELRVEHRVRARENWPRQRSRRYLKRPAPHRQPDQRRTKTSSLRARADATSAGGARWAAPRRK
jgi:hypothetical protein